MSDITYRYLSWGDIEKACLSIYANMCRDNYAPDVILGLLRGGVVPSRIFLDFYQITIDFCSIDVKLYDGINLKKPSPKIKSFLNDDIEGKKVLVVDDIWDSGKTMKAVLDYLKNHNTQVTTATLYFKETEVGQPDYYANVVPKEEWLVFPWEKYEFWRLINGAS